jgi:hypothetical protein
MIKFSDITGRARDLYAARYEPEGVRTLADLYWRSMLGVACLAVVCALAWGIFDLVGALDMLSATPDSTPLPPAAFNRSTLQHIVQGFEDRQAQFNSLGAQPLPAISDPSK